MGPRPSDDNVPGGIRDRIQQLMDDEELARNLQSMEDSGSAAPDATTTGGNPPAAAPIQILPPPSDSAPFAPPNDHVSLGGGGGGGSGGGGDVESVAASRAEIEEQLRIESEIVISQQREAEQSAATPATIDDEEVARKLEQTYRDEALAQRVQAQEEAVRRAELDRVQAEQLQAASAARGGGLCSRRTFCGTVVPVIIAVVITSVLFGVFFNSGGGTVPPIFTDKWGGDDGDQGEFLRWRNPDGSGLELTIVNRLDHVWHEYFDRAIEDWDNGDPDSLALNTYAQEPNSKCPPELGKMVVCNGYYGRTGWTGLNEVYFSGPYIKQSVARMNEDYLKRADYGLRQYVMCHEMGHGFGLPHRDINPTNPDTGSCLDYTIRPENNAQPDNVDYANLESLYGRVGARRRTNRRHFHQDMESTLSEENIALSLTYYHDYKTNARLLHKSEGVEVYERHLENDQRVVTHVLLAT